MCDSLRSCALVSAVNIIQRSAFNPAKVYHIGNDINSNSIGTVPGSIDAAENEQAQGRQATY